MLGHPPTELGGRAPGEQPRRRATRPGPSASSQSPLQDFEGIITPSDLHFERHHGGVAEIEAQDDVDDDLGFFLAGLQGFTPASASGKIGEGRADPQAIAAIYNLLSENLASLAQAEIERNYFHHPM